LSERKYSRLVLNFTDDPIDELLRERFAGTRGKTNSLIIREALLEYFEQRNALESNRGVLLRKIDRKIEKYTFQPGGKRSRWRRHIVEELNEIRKEVVKL
jgi:hypothetical protein